MKFHAECAACLLESRVKKIAGVKDENLKMEYARRVCKILADANPETDAPPLVDSRVVQLQRSMMGFVDDYTEINRSFNRLLLGIYDRLQQRVAEAEDPLYMAIQLSMAGNYIDFGVLKDVHEDRLLELLDEAAEKHVDRSEYENLRRDMEKPGEIVLLHDNNGEIVLDKLLIETIKQYYPDQKVVSVVRGNPILNDATMDDAVFIGLDKVSEVITNGVEDVAGTIPEMLPEDVYKRITGAKLVLAKGQGNFETLVGCGMNVYYLFLCKCAHYTTWYGLERFSGVLAHDGRLTFREK